MTEPKSPQKDHPMNNTKSGTAEAVERVAYAMARVIAYRHGSYRPDDWLNDERREEARAAITALSSTPSDTGDELREALTAARIAFKQIEQNPRTPTKARDIAGAQAHFIDTALAKLRASHETRLTPVTAEWQPIETAPKDGTDILVVHRENRSFLQIVAWEDGETVFKWCSPDGPDYHENAFSHWMPLPEPPARTAGDDE
jgi:hypothetical protein